MAEEPKVTDPSPSRSMMRRRQDTLFGTLRRFSRLWGFLAFLIGVILLFRGVVIPFIFGLLIAYILSPIVARLQPKIGRVLAVILCYLAILAAMVAFFGLLLPAVASDLARLRTTAPDAVEKINEEWLPRASQWADEKYGQILGAGPKPEPGETPPPSEVILEPQPDGTYRVDLKNVRLSVEEQNDGSLLIGPPQADAGKSVELDLGGKVREWIVQKSAEATEFIGPAIQALVSGVAGFLTSFVLTFMIAAFVLVDLARVNRFARSLIPHEYRLDFEDIWKNMDKGLSGVIRGQLLICLVNGVLTFIGLIIFQIKYAFLLAVLAGIFSLIPIFGTIISSIPIIVIALISSEQGLSVGPALGILAWIVGIHLLEANVLNPKIIGDSAHIHPVIVIFALLAGENVYGLTGALLAIPATSLVQTLYLYARRTSTVFRRESEPRL